MSVSILEGIASKSKKDERGFCLILNRLTESLFFDGVLGNPKIEQIKPWSARGLEKSLRPIRRGAASRARLRIKKTREQGTSNGKNGSDTPWADGLANLCHNVRICV